MKRLFLGLIVASGLALMAAAPAGAVGPGVCGNSYAMLINGADPTTVTADGSPTQPGALTHAVGVGVISFGTGTTTGCTISGGALIYNAGDVQASGSPGLYVGPAHCYDGISALGTGLPCWDGGSASEMTGSLVTPGVNGNGSYDLHMFAKYAWIDGSIAPGTTPFAFTLQNTLGSSIVVGAAKSDHGVGAAPILTITMQKIGHAGAVPTALGVAPYLGLVSVSCLAWGANTSDFVAAGQASAGASIAGGAQSVIGAVQTFSNGLAGGSLSFNGNDDIVTTGTSPNNDDCATQIFPGTAFGGTFAFPDGTSNTVASIGSSVGPCSNDKTAGAGYANSSVQWGATDSSSYLTTTGLFSTATGFVPPGGESTCTTYLNVPPGIVTNVVAPPSLTVIDPATVATAPIKFTNTTPADCGISAALAGTTTDGTCTLSVTPSFDSLPDSPQTVVGMLSCTCTAEDEGTVSATLNFTSSTCQLTGTVSRTVTCTR